MKTGQLQTGRQQEFCTATNPLMCLLDNPRASDVDATVPASQLRLYGCGERKLNRSFGTY